MKKEKNLFSIGEIAKALGVTRRIILNYEQRGLIQPDIKEGTTGNRYYTIDSFTKLRSIRIFQNLGLSLDEIRAYFNDSSDILPLIRRLEKLRDELNLNIEKLYERVQTGEAQIKTIRLERQRIYRRSYHSETIAERTVALRNTALEAMHAYGTDTTRRMYFTEYPVTAKRFPSAWRFRPKARGNLSNGQSLCLRSAFITTGRMRRCMTWCKSFWNMPRKTA